MLRLLRALAETERGVTAIEYAVIAAVVVVAVAAGAGPIGSQLAGSVDQVSTLMTTTGR
jgi:Flp pilus assembly pilin Flp